jgi:hypothetical protein
MEVVVLLVQIYVQFDLCWCVAVMLEAGTEAGTAVEAAHSAIGSF